MVVTLTISNVLVGHIASIALKLKHRHAPIFIAVRPSFFSIIEHCVVSDRIIFE